MDWNSLLTTVAPGLLGGGGGFFGAFFNFKERLKKSEQELDALKTQMKLLMEELSLLKSQHSQVSAGWRLEFDNFHDDFEREMRHHTEINEVRDKERQSRPDPIEAFHRELEQLRQDIGKLKERGGKYVSNTAFIAFTKAQEEQWKEMARTLGRLEGMFRP